MTVTVADIIDCIDALAPFSLAESWDNVGLIVGARGRPVKSILIGLDPTVALLEEAIARRADTVITHHPAIFRPIAAIETDDPAGIFLEKALRAGITVLASHTNFDHTRQGVNDALAELLGLEDVRPLVPADPPADPGAGTGRIGRFSEARSSRDFVRLLLDAFGLDSVQMAGTMPERIGTVALCGGSGSDFAAAARRSGADVYISAEIKHHVGRWAEASGFCVIDGTHYATEQPAVDLLARRLSRYSEEKNWGLDVKQTTTEHHPFSTVNRYSYQEQQQTGDEP